MELTIELNDTQIKFLKEFSTRHFQGAKENECIDRPLHLVQTKTYEYIATPDKGDYNVYVNTNNDFYPIRDPKDVIIKYGTYEDENDIVDYNAAITNGINNEPIKDLNTYFKYYAIPDNIAVYSAKESYETVAYFFIKKEARNYMYNQMSNLNEPRIHSIHRGYSNDERYEYEHFYDLLLMVGNQLNEKITSDDKIKCIMLKKLNDQCVHYLSDTSAEASELWAGSAKLHIDKMKELYLSLTVKPSWITMTKINQYAICMNSNPPTNDLADEIEQYFYDRQEYNRIASERITWLRNENNQPRTRIQVKNVIYDALLHDIDPLIRYFTYESSILLDQNDETAITALNIKKRLIAKKQGG